ncbi:NUDIX hydrolase [Spirilliplanes yamanashiensis]|uniref:NUDIX hydrolase n=1 Tax=Spirilliplanes yamanashiensis TaxID=42233 RepID=A0A8J4DHA9_9ACTN|nr:NUDIX domain-containing protein [Spirilliplanes yamanashiensis]MDP9819968.1 8-oxo-dGTP pyrophosphatase MutT (NUDIX family) [Spirilliplanes yamanashiensis]GIJ01213.1 NUDIX hydrolase [Spirilliplanes yamanashiensis]
MPKTDYLNDPDAPRANALVVAVAVVVLDESGRVLLIRRSDNGYWALPGGAQDLGESTAQAAIREVSEETGIDVEIVGISGIYSNPRHVIAYDDGEVRQEFSICLRARPVGGSLRTSDESSQVDWVDPAELAERRIHPTMLLRIKHGLEAQEPYIG